MSRAAVRVGVGTRFRYDGQSVEVVEMAATTAGNEVVLKDDHGRLLRLSLKESLFSDRAVVSPDGPGPCSDDEGEIASVVLGQLDTEEKQKVLERAGHVREVLLTGYRSGSGALAADGEPRVTTARQCRWRRGRQSRQRNLALRPVPTPGLHRTASP